MTRSDAVLPQAAELVPAQAGHRTAQRNERDRWPRPLLAASVILAVALPLLLAVVSGSLRIPHNDAWAYSRIAQNFARTGHIELLSWNRSALIGQFVVLGPLARSLTIQQLYVAVLAVVALCATYDLLVPTIGKRRSAFGVLTVAIWPGFGLMSTTFMADVPAMAAMTVSLAIGRRALVSGSGRLLAVALLAGFWGVTIREQALAAPVALLLLAFVQTVRRRTLRLSTVLCGIAGFLLAVAAFELWRRALPDGDPPQINGPHLMLVALMQTFLQAYFTMALAMAPVVFLVARPWTWRPATWLVVAVTAAVAILAVIDYGQAGLFLPNYIDPAGPYWIAGNGHPKVVPVAAWPVVVTLACVSGVLMSGVLVRRIRTLDPLLAVLAGLVVMGTVGAELTGQPVFDRYCLMVAAPLLAVLLSDSTARSPRRLRVAQSSVTVVITAAVATLSLAMTAGGMAYDTARWQTAQRLVAAGAPAGHVDVGLEWNGYHSTKRTPMVGMITFPEMIPCFRATADVSPTTTPYEVVTYKTFILFGTSKLQVYNQSLPGCGTHTGTSSLADAFGSVVTGKVDSAGDVWVDTQTSAGDPFEGWRQVSSGGGYIGMPALALTPQGAQNVFVRSAAGAIDRFQHSGSGWGARTALPGGPSFVSDPAVVATTDGALIVSALDAAGDVWADSQTSPDGGFEGWKKVSKVGDQAGSPAAVLSPAGGGTENVFVRTSSGAIAIYWRSGPWRERFVLPGGPTFVGDPAVATAINGAMSVAAVDKNGDVWINGQAVPGEPFTGWHKVSTVGGLVGTPALALSPAGAGTLNLFVRTRTGTVAVFGQTAAGGGWRDGTVLSGGPAFARGLAATVDSNGAMSVSGVDAVGDLWVAAQPAQGMPFGTWSKIS